MKKIFVTFQKKGIHSFPGASGSGFEDVHFLSYPHRHLFKFKVIIEVFHNDREIEFLQFQDFCESLFNENTLSLNNKSCEMISDELANEIQKRYPGRFIQIEVSEDGENGSIIDYEYIKNV